MLRRAAAWRRGAGAAFLALAAVLVATALPDRPARAQTAQTVTTDWALIPKDADNKPRFRLGQSFRLLFISSTEIDATSPGIATYNAHVRGAATSNDALKPFKDEFRAIVSTAAVHARDNTATTYTPTNKGVPIYWVGGAKVADDYADFYDGSWDAQAAGDGRDEEGGTNLPSTAMYTGSKDDGTRYPGQYVGQSRGANVFVRLGELGSNRSPLSWESGAFPTLELPLYGLSPVITVTLAKPLAPTALLAKSAGQTAIDLSWTAPVAAATRSAVTGYEIQWSADGTKGWAALTNITSAATRAYRHSGLRAGTTRHYRVRATSKAGAGAWSAPAQASTAPPDRPLAPTGLSPSAAGQTAIDLSWTAPAPAPTRAAVSGYEVEWSADGAGPWTALTTTTAAIRTYRHTGLSPGTTRHYRVRATSSAGSGPWSAVAQASTAPLGKPLAPTGVSAHAAGLSTINVWWAANNPSVARAAVSGYEVEWSADGADPWTALTTTTAAIRAYRHTGLSPATTRHYRVRATSSAGAGPWSAVVQASTWPEPATPVAQTVGTGWALIPKDAGNDPLVAAGGRFRLLFVTSGTVEATSTDIATYNDHVQRAANANATLRPFKGEFRALVSTATNDASGNTATTHTATNRGVPIYWVGGAKVADDYADFYDGSWDSRAAKTQTGARWSSRFDVWTGTNADGTRHASAYAGASRVRYGRPTGGSALSLSDSRFPFLPFSLYALSPTITVLAVPAAPSGLDADAPGQTAVGLTWTAPAAATTRAAVSGYEVEWSADGADPWTALATVTGTSASHTGLDPGTTRHYRVRATSEVGAGPWSAVAHATTAPLYAPLAPTGLAARATGRTAIDLAWTAPEADSATRAAVSGYEVEWSADGADPWTALTTTTAAIRAYRHTGLGPGTTRHYRVRATSSAGAGAWSAPAQASSRAALIAPAAQTVPPGWALIPKDSKDDPLVAPGASFRLLFATSTATPATSGNIATYNAFVQTAANANATLRPFKGEFRAVVSTALDDARDNTATTHTESDKGVPVYWVGGERVADDYADFYDGSWDSRAAKTEAGTDRSAGAGDLWTGSKADGTRHASAHAGASGVRYGRLTSGRSPLSDGSGAPILSRSLYALSPVITVRALPLAPAGLRATVVGHAAIDLAWTAPAAAVTRAAVSGYEIEWSADGTGAGPHCRASRPRRPVTAA